MAPSAIIRVQNQCLNQSGKCSGLYPECDSSAVYGVLPGMSSMLARLQSVVVLSCSISPVHRGLLAIDPLAQREPPRPFSLHAASNPNNTKFTIRTGCGGTETILSRAAPSPHPWKPSSFQGGKLLFLSPFPKVQQAQEAGWTLPSSIF